MHEDPQVIFFCDQHDFLFAKDALSGRVTEEFPAVGKPEHTKEHIKKDSNRYFLGKF